MCGSAGHGQRRSSVIWTVQGGRAVARLIGKERVVVAKVDVALVVVAHG
jgi:hypothetical protein